MTARGALSAAGADTSGRRSRAGSDAPPRLTGHESHMTLDVRPKRVYERSDSSDGYRVLIDHIWPRGVSHARAALDEWARELAPSSHLRTWFDHRPERFEEFRRRYRDELAAHSDRLNDLRSRAATGRVTIVYAARDRDHNNAIVLAELLRDH